MSQIDIRFGIIKGWAEHIASPNHVIMNIKYTI